jgi:hypothetical protein
MPENHLTPERTIQIVEEANITPAEMEHVKTCASCNGWLRAFAALAVATGKKLEFEIPPDPQLN